MTRRAVLAVALLAMCSAPTTAAARGAHASLPFSWRFPAFATGSRWSSKAGMLSYDGTSNGYLMAPVTIAPGTSFAVQAQVQVLGLGPSGLVQGAGVFAQTKAGNLHTMVDGGDFISYSANAANVGQLIAWNGMTIGGNAITAGTAWHTYRLEVRGSQYTLFADGKQMVQFTIADRANPVRVGVFSEFVQSRIRKFIVTPLGGGPPAAQPEPPLSKLVLGFPDLPAGLYFAQGESHYYTDQEIARLDNETVQQVESTGRLLAFERDFFGETLSLGLVEDEVIAYSTPQQARDAVATQYAAQYAEAKANLPPGSSDLRNVPMTVGESNRTFAFSFPDPNLTYQTDTFEFVQFSRGRYDVHLVVQAMGATAAEAEAATDTYALDLSRIEDQRIAASG